MIRLLVILCIVVSATVHGSDLLFNDGDRIVIEGDSYADQKKWSCYLCGYLILRHPELNIHCQVMARGGVSISQSLDDSTGYHGYDEYGKTVYALSPKWVFDNLGANGGVTVPQYVSQTTDLIDNYVVSRNSATPIIMGVFPSLKADGQAIYGNYESAAITLGANRGWQVAAVWHYLLPIWSNSANWSTLSTTLNSHVDTSGNILEFYAIVHTLGFSTVVANSTVNAIDQTVTSQTNSVVTNVAGNGYSGIDFDRLDQKLPVTYDYDNAGFEKAVGLLPELSNWQDYSITVTGLSVGNYDVFCDGIQIGNGISDATLSSGWNISSLRAGPTFNQTQEVLGRIRDMLGVDRVTLANKQSPDPFGHLPAGWRGVYRYKSNAGGFYSAGQRGETLRASLQPAITEIDNYDALIHAAAQPVTHHYSIRSSSSPTPNPSPSPTSTALTTNTPTPTATCTCP